MNEKLRGIARKLRAERRMSYNEIGDELDISKATMHEWLKDLPLTDKEKSDRMFMAGKKTKKDPGVESKHYSVIKGLQLSGAHKNRIAESAILFRLALYGLVSYSSIFDGEKFDMLVYSPLKDKIWKVQVKWARKGKHGLPTIRLMCANGRAKYRKYLAKEVDFFVAYNLFTDTAYVIPYDKTEDKGVITINKNFEEAFGAMV